MFFIDMQLVPGDLAARMCEMRIWLDRHNVETSGFSLEDRTTVRIAFRVKREAEAFAVRFAGREIPTDPPIRLRGRPAPMPFMAVKAGPALAA
jgi:hypothetical protein